MTRRKPKPDKRPRWDDLGLKPYIGGDLYEPETVSKLCKTFLTTSDQPEWRKDPTYDLRKKRK